MELCKRHGSGVTDDHSLTTRSKTPERRRDSHEGARHDTRGGARDGARDGVKGGARGDTGDANKSEMNDIRTVLKTALDIALDAAFDMVLGTAPKRRRNGAQKDSLRQRPGRCARRYPTVLDTAPEIAFEIAHEWRSKQRTKVLERKLR